MAKARLEQIYRDTIVSKLKETLELSNVMEVPKITKITVNMGVGEAVADKKIMDNAVGDLDQDHRAEAAGHASAQVGCDLQGPRRSGDRRQGDAARRAYV